MERVWIAFFTSGPSLTLTTVRSVEPTNRPLVTLPLTVEVMTPLRRDLRCGLGRERRGLVVVPRDRVVERHRRAARERRDVDLGGLDRALAGATGHAAALAGLDRQDDADRLRGQRPGQAGRDRDRAVGFPQVVPPAAPAGPAVSTAIGANKAMAIVNKQILLINCPSRGPLGRSAGASALHRSGARHTPTSA